MSKLSEHLNEINNFNNTPDSVAKNVDGTFEDILFQLESIADMGAINFNIRKKLRKSISDLRKLGIEISHDIRSGK